MIAFYCDYGHVFNCISGSGTDPFLLLILFFFLGPNAPSFQIGPRRNMAGVFFKYTLIDWRSLIFDLLSHFQDGGHDVISSRKVLPSGDCTCSVHCTVYMQPASYSIYSSWFIVHSYLFDEMCFNIFSPNNFKDNVVSPLCFVPISCFLWSCIYVLVLGQSASDQIFSFLFCSSKKQHFTAWCYAQHCYATL